MPQSYPLDLQPTHLHDFADPGSLSFRYQPKAATWAVSSALRIRNLPRPTRTLSISVLQVLSQSLHSDSLHGSRVVPHVSVRVRLPTPKGRSSTMQNITDTLVGDRSSISHQWSWRIRQAGKHNDSENDRHPKDLRKLPRFHMGLAYLTE